MIHEHITRHSPASGGSWLLAVVCFALPATTPTAAACELAAEIRQTAREIATGERIVVARSDFRPWPSADHRDHWADADPIMGERIREAALHQEPLPQVSASEFLRFVTEGDRRGYESIYFHRRRALRVWGLTACLTGTEEYDASLADLIWATCEETFWGLPAHLYLQREGYGLPDIDEPVIDLYAAETAATLASLRYLLESHHTGIPAQVWARVSREIRRRVLTPFMERDDFHWMGASRTSDKPLSNWTPWIVSNVMHAALLVESDDAERRRIFVKALELMARYAETQPADGYCEEGPTYWARSAGAFFDCLELADRALGGRWSIFDQPKVHALMTYIVRMNLQGRWFANFGDASARPSLEGDLLFRMGEGLGEPDLTNLGAEFFKTDEQRGLRELENLPRLIHALFAGPRIRSLNPIPSFAGSFHFPASAMGILRGSMPSDGARFSLAWRAGHNGRSHGHLDAGSFILFRGEQPLIVDAGTERYDRKSFSDQRHEIWTVRSKFHNVPLINGQEQMPGAAYGVAGLAVADDDNTPTVSFDLHPAYPSAAQLSTWRRTFSLMSDTEVSISEKIMVAGDELAIECHFLLAAEPVIDEKNSQIILRGGSPASNQRRVDLTYPFILTPMVEIVHLHDGLLVPVWGDRLWLLSFVGVLRQGESELVFTIDSAEQ